MVDFYPTLAELCGLRPPAYLAGVSLVPALEHPDAQPGRSALTQYANGYSLRTDRYRYTEWGEQGREGSELYDHQVDPREMTNLAGQPNQADLVGQLAQQLHDRISAARKSPRIK